MLRSARRVTHGSRRRAVVARVRRRVLLVDLRRVGAWGGEVLFPSIVKGIAVCALRLDGDAAADFSNPNEKVDGPIAA